MKRCWLLKKYVSVYSDAQAAATFLSCACSLNAFLCSPCWMISLCVTWRVNFIDRGATWTFRRVFLAALEPIKNVQTTVVTISSYTWRGKYTFTKSSGVSWCTSFRCWRVAVRGGTLRFTQTRKKTQHFGSGFNLSQPNGPFLVKNRRESFTLRSKSGTAW